MRRRWILASLGIAGISTLGVAGFPKTTRVCPAPGIPARDYQFGTRSAHTEKVSSTGMLIENRTPVANVRPRPGEPPLLPSLRVFQLREAALQVDHCLVSRLNVTLHADGRYMVSARGDQNFVKTLAPNDPGILRDLPTDVFTKHLKRNQFHLRIRCTVTSPDVTKLVENIQGRATLVKLEPPAFWVQNGQPYDYFFEGTHPDIARFFDLWNKIEVDFYYR